MAPAPNRLWVSDFTCVSTWSGFVYVAFVNELRSEGFVEFKPNPNHRRAHFVVLTKRGKSIFEAAERQQEPWVNSLAEGLPIKDIATAMQVTETLRERLENTGDSG